MMSWPAVLTPPDDLLTELRSARPTEGALPESWLSQWESVWLPLAGWLAKKNNGAHQPLIVGVHGGQGSGKSTLSCALRDIYRIAFNWNVVVISIDDLYLSHAERITLGQTVHPLLKTRGVPGTHDVRLGMQLFDQLKELKQGETLFFPAFDKASDDRLPEPEWHSVTGPVDMIIFEGWCVGCQPEGDVSLATPINELEASEDGDGSWRRWVNQQLTGDYSRWYGMLDELIMLKVPDMAAVLRWRSQQETENKARARGTTDRSFDEAALIRFIQHYERLTRNALGTLPEQASLVLNINQAHEVDDVMAGGKAS